MKIPISKRLLCCAGLVENGAHVADIGADHGYLGIYLLKSGIAASVHASEKREKPLSSAKENAQRFGVAQRMHFYHADGLQAISRDSVDTIVCAGLGGDAIAQILRDCAWVHDARYRLILQPQSSGNDLRRKLFEDGFGIEREMLVQDKGFIYNVIVASFGAAEALTPGQQYLPPQLDRSDPLYAQYRLRVIAALKKTVAGIERAREDSPRLRYYRAALEEMEDRL
ncbi:MAG: class I SAM-dependent methyltransferase [Oscillospiraceae bacterium]|jgi:tRNA (adenine22-N1)-methyltransferase|nr:class I SAM-dependent methyltransferase [Oscillospiraceae bacterium]